MRRDTFHYNRFFKAPSNLALAFSWDQASTIYLGNLFHCLTILIVKNVILTASLNLPSSSLIDLCPIATCACKKSVPHLSHRPYFSTAKLL